MNLDAYLILYAKLTENRSKMGILGKQIDRERKTKTIHSQMNERQNVIWSLYFQARISFCQDIMQVTFSSSGVGGVGEKERIHITDYLTGEN